MKVIYRGGHVKTIPQKYRSIKGLGEIFKDSKHKRLTNKERLLLDVELLKLKLSIYDLEFIQGKPFNGVGRVDCKFGEPYYVALFGTIQVRCSRNLYNSCPDKKVFKKYH